MAVKTNALRPYADSLPYLITPWAAPVVPHIWREHSPAGGRPDPAHERAPVGRAPQQPVQDHDVILDVLISSELLAGPQGHGLVLAPVISGEMLSKGCS